MREKKKLINIVIVAFAVMAPFLLGAFTAPQYFEIKLNSVKAQTSIPACMDRENIPESEMYWIYVPQSADELHSEDYLQWLAGRLIETKVVDASSCPAGGIGAEGYANACGMALAQSAAVTIQNSINQPILDAWKEVGVPPVLLKQLIRYESQFWPAQYITTHYGFGHVTPIGALNALQWSPNLVSEACTTPGSCGATTTEAQTLLQMMLNVCPTCPNGIDANGANRSVHLLAEVVMAYCNQTAQLVFNATGWQSTNVVDYATLWKLTLVNYNAGSTCVFNAVRDAFKANNGPVQWSDILAYTSSAQCKRGTYYANLITSKEYNFPPAQ